MSSEFSIDRSVWLSILSKAWTDEHYKEKLINDPNAALAEFNIEIPRGIKLNIQENSETTMHFTLPQPPTNEKLDLGDAPEIFASTGLPTLCCGTNPPSV